MKKIYSLMVFLIFSTLSFADLNDTLNLLKKEDAKNIEEKINRIEKDKKISLYVNILPIDEGFALSDPEQSIIINLKKKNDQRKFETEISFTKDINIDEYEEEIESIFTSTEKLLEIENYSEYIESILENLEILLKDIDTKPLNEMNMIMEEQEQEGNILYIVFIILLFLAVAIYVFFNRFSSSIFKKKKNM